MATTNIEINGVIDTSNKVLDNINRIADAALCFVTWDLELGKWSVILQQAETSSRSFDDSNIVGSISVGGTGVDQTYTSATIRFPHKDLNSNSDFITVEVASGDRYPNEIDNDLSLNTDLVNDPAHAQQIAAIELKNSRLDQVIQFSTDYTSLGITAGDVIDLTSAQYGFSGKLYRVITVRERDLDDGTLLIDITAKEFADVFANSLSRDDRNRETGITTPPPPPPPTPPPVPKSDCMCLVASYGGPSVTITPYTNTYGETDKEFFTWSYFDNILGINVLEIGFDPAVSLHRYDTGVIHTAKESGFYLIYAWHYLNWSQPNFAAGDRVWQPENDPTKPRFLTQIHYKKNGQYTNAGATKSIITGSDVGNFEDYLGNFIVFLNKDDTLEFVVRTKTDFGPSHPEMDPATNVGIASVYEVFFLS